MSTFASSEYPDEMQHNDNAGSTLFVKLKKDPQTNE